MSLDVEIKARVTKATKQELAAIAEQRGGAEQGVKISSIVREAVFEYLERHAKGEVISTDAVGKEIEAQSPQNGPKIGFHKKKIVLARVVRARASTTKSGTTKPKFHRTYELNYSGDIPPRKHLKPADLAR